MVERFIANEFDGRNNATLITLYGACSANELSCAGKLAGELLFARNSLINNSFGLEIL